MYLLAGPALQPNVAVARIIAQTAIIVIAFMIISRLRGCGTSHRPADVGRAMRPRIG